MEGAGRGYTGVSGEDDGVRLTSGLRNMINCSLSLRVRINMYILCKTVELRKRFI
jgi:hypothetical protein